MRSQALRARVDDFEQRAAYESGVALYESAGFGRAGAGGFAPSERRALLAERFGPTPPPAFGPPTRKCNRRGVSFNPLEVGARDARVSVEFEIQRHPALISSLTPASECHSARAVKSHS